MSESGLEQLHPTTLPALDTSHGTQADPLAFSSASESEYQHALEVVFDEDNLYRRKSSLAPADAPRLIQQRAEQRAETACFVHQLLEKKKRKANNAGDVDDLKSAQDDSRPDEESPNHGSTATHSRLLTKKQLSDMAWGVRELSKKLGSLRLRLNVKTVFVLTKAYDQSLLQNTRDVVEWLLSNEQATPYTVYVEDILETNTKFNAKGLIAKDPSREGRLKYWTNQMCAHHPHTFDIVVTLGGDGTVLYASWLFQRVVPPVLSFALGSLGFLTKFDYSQYQDTLTSSFQDGITVSLRLRFEGTVMRSKTRGHGETLDLVEELVGEESDNNHTHKPDKTYEILNDIVVDRGPSPIMSSIEIFGDDEHFTTVQADGVCVSTPTGSTAYNLAAGGSLCHPENPVILVTGICAHTLSFRPIILPDTIVLRVGVPYDTRASSWASFDGRERVELFPGDYVTISASRYPFANVMPLGKRSEDWINSISRTLNWNSRQRQKGFTEWSDDKRIETEE